MDCWILIHEKKFFSYYVSEAHTGTDSELRIPFLWIIAFIIIFSHVEYLFIFQLKMYY